MKCTAAEWAWIVETALPTLGYGRPGQAFRNGMWLLARHLDDPQGVAMWAPDPEAD